MPFVIDVKHDTAHKGWHRLSVSALSPGRLVQDLEAHLIQYAADHQMNHHQLAGRIMEIRADQLGEKASKAPGQLHLERPSNATANRP